MHRPQNLLKSLSKNLLVCKPGLTIIIIIIIIIIVIIIIITINLFNVNTQNMQIMCIFKNSGL